MRITNQLMTDAVSFNLINNSTKVYDTQNSISTGKRINKPSDDPLGIGATMDYRKTIATIDQYQKNINHAMTWLEYTDSALEQTDQLLTRASEIALSQITAVPPSDATRQISAKEIEQIYEQMMRVANTSLEGSYIFSGYNTSTKPFTKNSDGIDGTGDDFEISWNGDDGEIKNIIGDDMELKINTTGSEVFHAEAKGGINIFDMLQNLKSALENNDIEKIENLRISLDDALKQVSTVRGEMGVKMSQLETSENYWASFKVHVTDMLTGTEEVDITKSLTDLTAHQTALEASLSAASVILKSANLVDFL